MYTDSWFFLLQTDASSHRARIEDTDEGEILCCVHNSHTKLIQMGDLHEDLLVTVIESNTV
jgi:hypothetical protein